MSPLDPHCFAPSQIADSSGAWLKVALEARGVPNFDKYTLHSLRRGAAQALVEKGCDLATLLMAGGWRSSAFRSYMDMAGIERSLFPKNVDLLLDFEEIDED